MSEIEKKVAAALVSVGKKKLKNIFFVACGGSLAELQWGEYLLDKELDIAVKSYTSNEFVYDFPKGLSSDSLVITRSHSGTTPETVEATKLARSKGALTIAISMVADSPLCSEAEYSVNYDYGPEIEMFNGDHAVYARFIYGFLLQATQDKKFERVLKSLEHIGEYYEKNKAIFAPMAQAFGEKYKRSDFIYTMASGIYYPQIYSFSSCLLMEMLWVNSNPIHAGEYFHGPFEVTDYDVPFLVIKGDGKTRKLDQRALEFVHKFSKEVVTIDVAEFDLGDTEDDIREYLSSVVISPVIRSFAQALSDAKGHPLSVRRYMWKMDY